jgi:hypothetical protein
MILDLSTLQAQYDAVKDGKSSREAASDWAREMREVDDRRELTITPESARSKIWEALLFLESYDMKTAPNTYLYDVEDLIAHRP